MELPNCIPLTVGNKYHPPHGNVKTFIQVLYNAFIEIDLTKFEIYLMGDVNSDILDIVRL